MRRASATILSLILISVLCLPTVGFADNETPAEPPAEPDSSLTTAPLPAEPEQAPTPVPLPEEENKETDGKFFVIGDNAASALAGAEEISSGLEESGTEVGTVEQLDATLLVIDTAGGVETVEQAESIAEELPAVNVVPVRKYKLAESYYDPKDYFEECPSFQGAAFGEGFESGAEHIGGASTVKPYQMAEKTGRTATVAVIDSGCRVSHKMLTGKVLTNLAYNSITGKKGAAAVTDNVDHGTGVASVIAANPNVCVDEEAQIFRTGVAANTKILPIKAFNDEDESFDDVSLIKALNYVETLVDNGTVSNLHVVNMSLGALVLKEDYEADGYGNEETDPLYAKIRELHDDYGIICVCAAGNDGDNGIFGSGDNYTVPGDYDCCVSVMASDVADSLTYFSNTGPEKDLIATGWDILVAGSSSNSDYYEAQGTSYSAPIVSGAITTLIQLDPNLDVDEAEKLLEDAATPMTCRPEHTGNAHSVPAGCLGAGMLNVEKAVWLDYERRGKVWKYWNGISDAVKIKGTLYGFKVLSGDNRTAAATFIGEPDHVIDTVQFPDTVRLGDGRVYRVTSIRVPGFCNGIASLASENDVETNLVLGKNISEICNYTTCAYTGTINTITIKTTKLNSKNVKEHSFYAQTKIGKIVVAASDKHSTNYTVYKNAQQAFTKKRIECPVKSWYCATKAVKISTASIKLNTQTYAYNGKAKVPKATVKLAGANLVEGVDYKITYKRNVRAGTAKASITGIGDYSGTVIKPFTIKRSPLSKATLSLPKKSYKYTGKAITPPVSVKVGGAVLKQGRDYTVSYYSNKNRGTAKVVVKGKGSVTGSKTITFKIN